MSAKIVHRGQAWAWVWTWKNEHTGQPIDISGYSAALTVRERRGGAEVLSLTTGNGKITLGGSAGTVTAALVDTDTDDLVEGIYVFAVTVTGTSGVSTSTLAEGLFVVVDS